MITHDTTDYPVDSATRTCCGGIGGHTLDCPESTELTNGRWLGKRGIFRHDQPPVERAIEWSKENAGEVTFHTMCTAVSGEFSGNVRGELIRWACDGEIGYEVRINGIEEHGGICDVAAYSIGSLAALAKVANDLRYEWEIITGVYASEGITWSVW